MHIKQVWMSSNYSHTLRVHFINDVIEHLTNHFLLKRVSSTTYYPQRNGQVEFTYKVLGILLTKLISENKIDWDELLSIVLFS
jgi:hypothetical protein